MDEQSRWTESTTDIPGGTGQSNSKSDRGFDAWPVGTGKAGVMIPTRDMEVGS